MTDDQRRIASTVLTTLADSLPYWKDAAIVLLVGVVLGCLLFVAALYDG